jgi:predicted alpha-1,2-mannosidase
MKKTLLLLSLSMFLYSCDVENAEPETDFAQYVNPFVGTGLAGNTYPGALTPFGMIQLSPDTRADSWKNCSGYHYSDSLIYGFSHTHLSGTGCMDYSDILLMPFSNKTSIISAEYASAFSHENESASPGYYSVLLDKNNILVELTAGKRIGVQKYTFNDSNGEKGVLLDLQHRDKVLAASIEYDVEKQIVTGIRNSRMWNNNQLLSYAITFSQPVERMVLYKDDMPVVQYEMDKASNKLSLDGTNIKALIYFKSDIEELVVKTSISANIDPLAEAALKNMKQYDEYGFDFDLFKTKAREEWNTEFGKIAVETKDRKKKEVFYTALYHAFTSPYVFTDSDGAYLGMDYKIHQAEEGREVYTVFSLWDTYRALHPLFNLIDRKRSEDFLYTFMRQYEQSGALPIWELWADETDCMIAYHSIPVIYDAFVKGMRNYDPNQMLEAMVRSAKKTWRGLPELAQYGYIPADIENEGVSKVLECAYDDWCIAQFAKEIGNEDVYEEFNARCQYYKNILDPKGFMHAKANGSFLEPFDPREFNNTLTEANTWQYTTYVPHDADTYITLLGGEKVAEQFFDSLFYSSSVMTGRVFDDVTGIIGQYAHGNEPSHHAAYWYNFIGKAHKTAEIVRHIMREFYTTKPDGLCGNEDCGQMSAWYVFSAMGFYPFCPGSNQYVIGSPIFDRTTVRLENGKQFVIVCENQSDKNIYIKSATLNDRPLNRSFLTYNDIKDGGELIFTMSAKPNPAFGHSQEDRPHTKVENTITTIPYLSAPNKTFSGELTLSMNSYQPIKKDENNTFAYPAQTDAIYYTLDGSIPKTTSTRYTEPLRLSAETQIKVVAYNEQTGYSNVVEATYVPYIKDKDIISQTRCNTMYDGGGDEALIDCRRGTPIFSIGSWRGYLGKDFEVILDLREVRSFKEIGAGFLQDTGPWIIFPPVVTFEISDDNLNYRPYGSVKAPCTPEDLRAQTFDYVVKKPATARYVKISARNYGKMPEWHMAEGNDTYLFTDEIYVK